MSKINLLIRGHIRGSFYSEDLKNLIKILSARHDLSIFIHTWNIVQNNISWRRIDMIEDIVDENKILNYFSGLDHLIKKIIIDDDNNIPLIGKLEGRMCSTPCPVRGYKNMFYGMLQLASYVYENVDHNEMAVQHRFDILQNWSSSKIEDFVSFCERPLPTERKIEFWDNNRALMGLDNFYMATVENMYKFIKHLYVNLDELNEKYRPLRHQEHITFFERENF